MLTSNDGGKSFERIQIETDDDLQTSLTSGGNVLIYGSSRVLLLSSDGGNNFRETVLSNENGLAGHIKLENARMFYSRDGTLLRSDDNGQSFDEIEAPATGSINDHLITDETFLIVGKNGAIYSENEGQSFSRIDVPDDALSEADKVLDQLINIGSGGLFLRPSPFQPSLFQNGRKLARLADGTIVLFDTFGHIKRSEDEGRSFSIVAQDQRYALNKALSIGNTFFLTGSGGTVLKSVDSATTLTNQTKPNLKQSKHISILHPQKTLTPL